MAENIIVIDSDRCDFCGTCVGVCPEDAIDLEVSVIRIQKQKCQLCGSCVAICPFGAPEVSE